MPDPDVPVEGAVEGGRYRAVGTTPTPASTDAPPTVAPPTAAPTVDPPPGGDDVVGAEPAAVRDAAAALDGLGDELDRWAEATAGLRLELGPRGRRDDEDDGGADWASARPEPEPGAVPAAEPLAVPGLAERRRRAHAELVLVAEDEEPRRFAAQESERALHDLADRWQRGLTQRAEAFHDTAGRATATAAALDAAGGP